jgi:uncharacterized protein YwlG (UPF0340 family)
MVRDIISLAITFLAVFLGAWFIGAHLNRVSIPGRVLRVLGQPHVNVLDLNTALDRGEAA